MSMLHVEKKSQAGSTLAKVSPRPRAAEQGHQKWGQQHPQLHGDPTAHLLPLCWAMGNVLIHNSGLHSPRGSVWLQLLSCHRAPDGFGQRDGSLVGWGQRLRGSRGAWRGGAGKGLLLPPPWQCWGRFWSSTPRRGWWGCPDVTPTPLQACAFGVRGSPWDKTRAKVCGGPATISAISSGANVTLTARVLYWMC